MGGLINGEALYCVVVGVSVGLFFEVRDESKVPADTRWVAHKHNTGMQN